MIKAHNTVAINGPGSVRRWDDTLASAQNAHQSNTMYRTVPRLYTARLLLPATRIYAMLLHTLCWSVLSLAPLVASANVTECLSDELIGVLPADVQGPAQAIKELLAQPDLTRGKLSQAWGPDDLEFFKNEFIPNLKELVLAAWSQKDFFRCANDPDAQPQWPRDLKTALQCLKGYFGVFNINIPVEDSVSFAEVLIAKVNLRFLVTALDDFPEWAADPSQFNDQQWRAEAASFKLMLNLMLMSSFVEMLEVCTSSPDQQSLFFGCINQNNGGNLLEIQQTVSGFTGQLESIFSGLKSVAMELVDSGCTASWIFERYIPWHQAFRAPSKHCQLSVALDDFQAKLVAETILLKLNIGNLVGGGLFFPETSQEKLRKTLLEHINNTRQVVGDASENAHEFANQQQPLNAQDLVTGVGQLALTRVNACLVIMQGLVGMFECTKSLQDQARNDSTLELETLDGLRSAYEVARQLVESYAAVLCLGSEQITGDAEKDSFLLNMFAPPASKDNLILAKGIMDCAEVLDYQLGLGMVHYDWNRFPLELW